MGNIFEDAIWGWVLLTFVVAQLPQFSQATAMLGAVSAQLPFGPVLGVQFANAFTGLVGGTAGNATRPSASSRSRACPRSWRPARAS